MLFFTDSLALFLARELFAVVFLHWILKLKKWFWGISHDSGKATIDSNANGDQGPGKGPPPPRSPRGFDETPKERLLAC